MAQRQSRAEQRSWRGIVCNARFEKKGFCTDMSILWWGQGASWRLLNAEEEVKLKYWLHHPSLVLIQHHRLYRYYQCWPNPTLYQRDTLKKPQRIWGTFHLTCQLRRLGFLERDIAVKFFMCSFLMLWAQLSTADISKKQKLDSLSPGKGNRHILASTQRQTRQQILRTLLDLRNPVDHTYKPREAWLVWTLWSTC